MELRHLRYMVALAEHRSFTLAARAVHITQSTLSHQIRQLELELGRDLFDRSGRDVTLTEAGRTLLPGVQRALAELSDAIRSTKDLVQQDKRQVRILAASRGCARRIIASVLSTPDQGQVVCATIDEIWASVMPNRLDDDAVDFDIVIGDVQHLLPNWSFEPLYHEAFGLLVPSSHPFAGRRRVRIAELQGARAVFPSAPEPTRLILDDILDRAGIRLQVVAELNSVMATYEFARANNAIAIGLCNYRTHEPDMEFVLLEDPIPERTIGFMWHNDREGSPFVESFADRIRKRVGSTQTSSDRDFVIRPCASARMMSQELV